MGRLLRLVGLLALIAALFALLIGAWAYVLTPTADDVQTRVDAYARDRGAAVLSASAVPQQLSDAIVAIEDERFYQHHGVDSLGVARALLDDIRYRCACEGGSTITQQIAKLVYLDGSDYGFNKVEGMALALKIEMHLEKPEILADYLSIVPTGPTRTGMPAAACAYFGRPLNQLDLAAYALLAGLPQAPSFYDPLLHPEAALNRRAAVLHQLREDGFITPEELTAATAEPYVPPAHRSC